MAAPNEMSGTLQIISRSGDVVYRTTLTGTHQNIDISHIIPGNYLVVYDSGQGVISKKIIIE